MVYSDEIIRWSILRNYKIKKLWFFVLYTTNFIIFIKTYEKSILISNNFSLKSYKKESLNLIYKYKIQRKLMKASDKRFNFWSV